MKSFYLIAKEALVTSNIDYKSFLINEMITYSIKFRIKEPLERVEILNNPSYFEICEVVKPKNLLKREHLGTKRGLAVLLHSIAHIEYSAIDLAIDAVYRFRDTPLEFKQDWLEVASDEVRHFKMIEAILEDLGYSYGDFPVHQGLFDASQATADSLLERMAVIPRHYEATGLDVNPKIVEKLKSVKEKSSELKRAIDALNIIYKEEISHVQKGDRWFKYECKRRGLEPESRFLEILEKFDLLNRKNRKINVEARLEAGFKCSELKNFGVERC